MYIEDVPEIVQWAKASPEGLLDVVTFTLATIQQPLHKVSNIMDDIRDVGATSRFLWGSKRAGYQWAVANRGYLWRVALDIMARPVSIDRTADLVQHFMQVPGIGIVKAAFIAQMLGEDVACLDVHNLARLGLPRPKVPASLPASLKRTKVIEYVKLTRDTGGARYWWDTWCAFVAGRRNSPLKTAEQVSAYHVSAIIGVQTTP